MTRIVRLVRRGLTVGVVAVAATAPAGCGAGVRAPAGHVAARVPTASCVPEPIARAPLPQEVGVYRAGPLTLALGDDVAQHPQEWRGRRTSGSSAIAVLTSRRSAVLSVDASSRRRFALRFTPTGRGHRSPTLSDGRPAVRFPACGRRLHRFGLGAVLFRGRGCARLHVTQAGSPAVPMLIPIGNTLRGCATTGRVGRLSNRALPFLGVACRTPGSIACDRVGVGVHLREAATLVVVSVAGRLVTLSPPTDPPDDLWLGYLFAAHLRHGPLDVHIPARARQWHGIPVVWPRVHVTAFFPDGRAATLSATVQLHPGFG